MKQFRARRLEAGLCQRCGKNPPRPGLKTCGCDLDYQKRRTTKRTKAGLCRQCPEKISTSGSPFCEGCRAIANSLKTKKRRIREKRGLCIRCGDRPLGNRKWCDGCYERNREYIRDNKKAIVAHYGGQCECCGEREISFLTMDHVNGGGTAHRKEIKRGNIYTWLRANGCPAGFAVLCFNCNCGRSVNGGVCPHKKTQFS